MFDVVIIGCGIIGSAAAFYLSRYDLRIAVLEAENDVATGTTKANSAIIHAGYDPEPGTLMAKLNVRGAEETKALCSKLDVPYKQIGSLVLAFEQNELALLEKLLNRGKLNGVPNMEILDSQRLHELEPEVSPEAIAALYAPTAAIINPWEYALALAETAVLNGAELHLNSKVTKINKTFFGYEVTAGNNLYRTRTIVNAAGVFADKIHDMVAAPAFKIRSDRGEYYLLDKTEGKRVSHVIFQCPTKTGKGVLVAPTVHGNLIVGPSNTATEGENVANTSEGLRFVGKMVRKSIPRLNLRESIRNFAGVRAVSSEDDFIIKEADGCPGFIDLAGIKSPGLSAAPAIAEMAVELIKETRLEFKQKDSFISIGKHIRFKELPLPEQMELISRDARYGRIICRCESITEGEILDALHRPIPPRSIDGIKRRCNAGMGRCQGGFCGPRVLEILTRELGINPLDIVQDRDGSWILESETKGVKKSRV